MSSVPERFGPEPVDPADLHGWLGWALDFFSDESLQNPHVDMTLQLDVTAAWTRYRGGASEDPAGASFFSFLVWHLVQTLAAHPSFNLRKLDGAWYLLRNPPVFIPVAVGGAERFRSLILEDVVGWDYPAFAAYYRDQLARVRAPDGPPPAASDIFRYAHFIGNLPNLRFTGLTLHWRPEQMVGQSFFYFGRRYFEGGRLLIPLSVRLHHSCTDPFVLNQLLEDFERRFAVDGQTPPQP